jgi:hypothetical protein
MLQAQVPAAVVAVVQQPTDQMGYLQHHIQAVQVVTVRNGQLVLELIMVEAAAVLAYIHQLLLLHQVVQVAAVPDLRQVRVLTGVVVLQEQPTKAAAVAAAETQQVHLVVQA